MSNAEHDDVVRRHPALALALATRFATLPLALLQGHRNKLDRNILAHNPSVPHARAGSEDAFPTQNLELSRLWSQFAETHRELEPHRRAQTFLDSHRAALEATYVTGYRMSGRDWEPEYATGFSLLARMAAFDWSEDLIVALADSLDGEALSANTGVPWTEALLERIPHASLAALSGNTHFPWSADFMARHADALDWRALSRNAGVPWTDDLVERFRERIAWTELAQNRGCPSLARVLEERADAIDWIQLSGSLSFPWTAERLRTFADRIDWRTLSERAALWNLALVEEHEQRVDLGARGLSANSQMTWTVPLLDRFIDRFDRKALSRNEALWSDVFAPRLERDALDAFLASLPPRSR